MSGAPPPQPGTAGTDDDPLDIETDVLELLNNTVGVATVENLVGVAADNTSTDGTLVYPTANGARGVPTDLAVRIDGVDRPVTAIEYADATGTLRPVTQWHLGPLGEFTLTLDSLTFVQPATFDVRISSTTSAVAPGDTLDVAVDVTNSGDETGTQTVTLDINNGVGQVDSASVTLSGGGAVTKTLSWSVPSNQSEQDYQATVSSADDTASQTVTVSTVPAAGDLRARYDATTLSLSDGDSVSTWADETGNANDLTAGIAPTFKTGVINGEPVVRFDGVDDVLDTAFFAISQPYQIFIVFQFQSFDTSSIETIYDSADSTTSPSGTLQVPASSTWRIFANTILDGGSPDTNPHISNALFDGTSSNHRLDGASIASGDTGSGDLNGFSVGQRGDLVLVPVLALAGEQTHMTHDTPQPREATE